MNTQSERTNALPSRKAQRARYSGGVRFQAGRELGGYAELRDVGMGGLSMTTDVRLEPGAHVLIELTDPRGEGFAELKGKVVWQRGATFGVRIFEDDESARYALADCLHAAMKAEYGLAGLRGRHRVFVDLAVAAAQDERPSVWQRFRPAVHLNGAKIATAGF